MQKLTLPVLPEIKKKHPGAKEDHYLLMSLPEFADRSDKSPICQGSSWNGNLSNRESAALCRTGDLSAVSKTDDLLSQLESIIPQSQAWQVIAAPVGAVPHVPNFIAGNPCSMRLRVRTRKEAAPLSIVVDLACSAGIGASDVHKRGVAILALVRGLAAVRPVELWAGCSIDSHGTDAVHIYTQIETAPLDLARAAHVLTHASVPRSIIYTIGQQDYGFRGDWPYYAGPQKEHGAAILKRAIGFAHDVLYVAPVFLNDEAVQNPTKWIADNLRDYGGDVMRADAA